MKYFYDVLTTAKGKPMLLLKNYLLTCPKKDFAKLYFDSLNTSNFADYERIRCIRHLNIYSLLTLDHKKRPAKK